MNCSICNNPKTEFKCDFGCIGAMEVLPTKIQRVLFEGMMVNREKTKNYLEDAIKQIKKGKNDEQ